jgi:hypothetical protein
MSDEVGSRGSVKRPFDSISDLEHADLLQDSVYYAQVIQETHDTGVPAGKSLKYRKLAMSGRGGGGAIDRLAKDRVMDVKEMYSPSEKVKTDHHRKLQDMHNAFAQSLVNAHRPKGPSVLGYTPTCSVDWDNSQLRWDRPGVPLCAANKACVALDLTLSQGPLHAFLLPGQNPNTGSLCLLCSRLHACMINDALEIVDPKGDAKLLLPPFNNLVNCPGGEVSVAFKTCHIFKVI